MNKERWFVADATVHIEAPTMEAAQEQMEEWAADHMPSNFVIGWTLTEEDEPPAPLLSAYEEQPMCECEGRENEFIWRGDPDWWSCINCDGRVVKLTEAEKRERFKGRENEAPAPLREVRQRESA